MTHNAFCIVTLPLYGRAHPRCQVRSDHACDNYLVQNQDETSKMMPSCSSEAAELNDMNDMRQLGHPDLHVTSGHFDLALTLPGRGGVGAPPPDGFSTTAQNALYIES